MWQFVETSLQDGTPVLLAAMAGVIAARAGIFHLGLEGLMSASAFVAVAVTAKAGNVWLGVLGAIGIAVLLSFVMWVVVVPLKANIVIAGLAISTIGLGGATFAQEAIFGTRSTIDAGGGLWRPLLETDFAMPQLSIVMLALPVIVTGTWFLLRRSSFGLVLASVGDYPYAARSTGASVERTRLSALLLGGVLCGLGGCQLSLGGLNAFSSDMTAGRGFIAFSAVVLGAAHPLGAAAASLFFGAASALGIQAQLHRWPVPLEIVLMLPYVMTIVAVAITGRLRRDANRAQAAFGELRS